MIFLVFFLQVPGRMGMLVTLYLISTNVYMSINAPPDRGFSFIELWFVGMQLPICIALVEYSIILGMKKYHNKIDNEENSQLFMKRSSYKELKKNEDTNTFHKSMDMIFSILSTIYFMIFCLCYWIVLN